MHGHLVDAHADAVLTEEHDDGRVFYRIPCPRCDWKAQREINPRGKDPTFAAGHGREIALVAFDTLLFHFDDLHAGELD
ncbi:MAG: hypothetical protein KGJ86_10340 [Chloroflexota bacterium]|nr:hypothetical protein [Chloroflexota bacterium]